MSETLVTQSSTIRRILSDPARGRVVLVSASGCAIYRLSDWTRVAWAALANITCGAINDNGIYLGTSAAGVYRLPLAANGLATSNLVRVFGIGAPVELTSAIIKDLAGYGSSLAIVTSAEMVFLPSPAVGYVYTGTATPLLCAITDSSLAWATTTTVNMHNSLPSADFGDTYHLVIEAAARTIFFEKGTSNLLISHSLGLRVVDCLASGGSVISGLVGHYTMDSVSGTSLIDSTGTQNGTISGATQVSGYIDQALSFDGTDDKVTIGSNAAHAFGTAGDFSYSVWFKTADTGRGDLLENGYNGTNGKWSGLYVNGGIFAGCIDDGTNAVFASGATNAWAINDNAWHLGIVTFDRDGNLQRYIDDMAYGNAYSITGVGNITDAVNGILLGQRQGSSAGDYFAGQMDALRIYNRLLDAAERTALYEETAATYGIDYTTSLGTITDCRSAWKDGALLAYGTSDDAAGGRFGVIDVTDPENPVSKTTTAGDVTGAVWIDAALAAAIYDTTLERYRLVAEISPAANAAGVRRDWTLYAEITDALGGIETGTVALTVNGTSQTPTVAAITNGFAVTYDPAGNSGYGERVTIVVAGTDSTGQTVSRSWVFTTASAPALTATDASPPNVVCIRDIDLATAESDEVVGGVNVVWLDTHTSPLIVTEAQSREVGRVKIDETTFHRHRVGVRVLATDSNGLQTRDLRPGSIATITCAALGMTAQKCEILAAQRTIDDSDEDISFDLQAAYYEEV